MFSFFNNSMSDNSKILFDFKINSINGEEINLQKFQGRTLLLVNVASKCGFTKQYDGLQKLWTNYKKDGLIIVGFPSNQFGSQEPGSEEEIKNFCETNFNIDFPLTKKIDVKGKNVDPIYKWAKDNYGNSSVPKWNFYKILINKEGKIFKTYNSMTKPMSKKLVADIENLLY